MRRKDLGDENDIKSGGKRGTNTRFPSTGGAVNDRKDLPYRWRGVTAVAW